MSYIYVPLVCKNTWTFTSLPIEIRYSTSVLCPGVKQNTAPNLTFVLTASPATASPSYSAPQLTWRYKMPGTWTDERLTVRTNSEPHPVTALGNYGPYKKQGRCKGFGWTHVWRYESVINPLYWKIVPLVIGVRSIAALVEKDLLVASIMRMRLKYINMPGLLDSLLSESTSFWLQAVLSASC